MFVLYAIVATLLGLFALFTYAQIWPGAEAYLYARTRSARGQPPEAPSSEPQGDGAAPPGAQPPGPDLPRGRPAPPARTLKDDRTPMVVDAVPDLDPLRARIVEAEAEQARLFDAYDTRFRSLSATDTLKARSELQALYARAEATRSRLLDLKNELRRALGQQPWPH